MSRIIYSIPNVPILQNRVYENQEAAKAAPTGDLRICYQDNFSWNADFDPNLMQYDDQYNNSVPSALFNSYYDRIADYLATQYDIQSGPIVDIGCGKGTFLKRMAARYEFIGIGIDPSYEGPASLGDLQFIAEEFQKRHLHVVPSLVLCRHTLEHIPEPTEFLTSILDALPVDTEIPVFCEVPDLRWILEQHSWWDFCYEHVNYFTSESFGRCLQDAGCAEVKVTPEFGGQYLWAEGVVNSNALTPEVAPLPMPPVEDMDAKIATVMERLKELSRTREIVIWGMATKGVMYALHATRHGVHVGYGVDINKEKQDKYAPGSGIVINAPEDLPKDQSYSVVCMNPNYMSEIREHLERLKLDFLLLEP